MTKEERIEKAVSLFKEGYNCSQSVVAAYADLYGFTREQALRMAASFGGGIGRMRETCGAACGMFLLAGLERSAVEGADREGKAANYALVQQLAENSRKRTVLYDVPICWDSPRRSRLYLLPKRVPVSIMPNALVPKWLKLLPVYLVISLNRNINCNRESLFLPVKTKFFSYSGTTKRVFL